MLSYSALGIKYPIQEDGKGDIANATGQDLEKNDILLLLGIEKGELPWDHNKGTRIRELLHSHIADEVTAKAIVFREATDQINTYAQDFIVTAASIKFEDQKAIISVEYAERDSVENDRRVVRLEVIR